ncbi:MAG: phosphodiesterase [Oscillospiraceae bacterium]|nr:phosphodiesterase [Oscillospiraceae bacterium]
MKLMFASDIHGSALYCEKMLEAYRREGAEKLCLLGDILYHGPRNDLPDGHAPKKVIAMLNEVKDELLCVRGNCDTEVDQMVLEFPVLADYAVLFVDGRSFFLSHGHHHNPDALPPLKKGDVLINGHSHVLKAFEKDGIHCLNDGSVSLPKENNPRSYMIYENGAFEIRELESGDTILTYKLN